MADSRATRRAQNGILRRTLRIPTRSVPIVGGQILAVRLRSVGVVPTIGVFLIDQHRRLEWRADKGV